MIIFENPYVSDELATHIAATQTPVLANKFSHNMAQRFNLNLLSDTDFISGINKGNRLLTVSENALEWIYQNVSNTSMLDGIRLMKDKHALRNALKPLYPDYFFLQVPAAELAQLDISTLSMPFILKPSVGFYSMGVYTIATEQDWKHALSEIKLNMEKWTATYPSSVLGENNFLLEAFIRGDEYAVDVYFNENGKPVILNLMKHDFASDKDVSDRLYYTSKEIIEQNLEPFTKFFEEMNQIVNVRNFPAHIELRITKEGRIIPIECNPMRFSGWGTTDLADFALGIKTYDYYLNNRAPDWESILRGKDGQLFSFIILDKPPVAAGKETTFDYQKLSADFTKVLHLRRMEKAQYPMFGFVFAQTPANDRSELDRIMQSDLTEYIIN